MASEGISALTAEQLTSALTRVERTNDMLPPREDDKVAGRIAARFVEGLHARTSSGNYRCERAASVQVPKRRLTTRTAAVLSLKDRVVFEAIVETARPRIAKYLVSPNCLIWPRSDESIPGWNKFEQAPTKINYGYVVSADVAGFYESINHGQLSMTLADAGVKSDIREAIINHLGDVMGNDRGLPQGVQTSDSLATVYLAQVDGRLQRSGLSFWRHGDDYRIWTPTYPKALSAIFILEQALRVHGLLLNDGKLIVESISQYTKNINDIEQASDHFRSRMKAARESALANATEMELAKAIEDADLDEDMQWRFFYNEANRPEVIAALAPSLTPKSIDVVVEMLTDLMSDKPREKLPAKLVHARLTFCIRRLARAKSPAALPWLGMLLIRRPDEVQDLSNYMLAIISKEPNEVVTACQYALTNKTHLLDWERAWIYRVLSRRADLVKRPVLNEARRVAESDGSNWLARVEAVRLMAKAGCLRQETAMIVARNSPECFRGDITGVIAMIEDNEDWAARYLDGARQDALEAVVIDAARDKLAKERRTTT